METRDGFIIGIHDYCDRWCERCAFTHRCRQFADERQLEFQMESPSAIPVLAAVSPAGPLTMPGVHDLHDDERVADPRFDADARALQVRVHLVTTRLRDWSLAATPGGDPHVCDALDVLNYYWIVASAKLYRALSHAIRAPGSGHPGDAAGSAKVVLLSLQRLEEAWLRLAERGCVGIADAEPVLRDLAAARAHVERRFPAAIRFVRPGFDEPVAVAMLEWQERG